MSEFLEPLCRTDWSTPEKGYLNIPFFYLNSDESSPCDEAKKIKGT